MARYKSSERPPVGKSVCIELYGKLHEGTYSVDGPMVTVETLTLGVKRAPLGDTDPLALARLILAELVFETALRYRALVR